MAIEGGAALPPGSPEEAALAKVPLLQVEGDFMTPEAQAAARKAITDRMASIGGDATTIILPEIGIKGNTHMMMMDKTSEKVADVVEKWIKGHVKKVRGEYLPQKHGHPTKTIETLRRGNPRRALQSPQPSEPAAHALRASAV